MRSLKIVFFFSMIMLPAIAQADNGNGNQNGTGNGGNGNNYGWGGGAANGVPLDGGLSLLIAAGAGYGIKKYKDSRKKNKETEPAN